MAIAIFDSLLASLDLFSMIILCLILVWPVLLVSVLVFGIGQFYKSEFKRHHPIREFRELFRKDLAYKPTNPFETSWMLCAVHGVFILIRSFSAIQYIKMWFRKSIPQSNSIEPSTFERTSTYIPAWVLELYLALWLIYEIGCGLYLNMNPSNQFITATIVTLMIARIIQVVFQGLYYTIFRTVFYGSSPLYSYGRSLIILLWYYLEAVLCYSVLYMTVGESFTRNGKDAVGINRFDDAIYTTLIHGQGITPITNTAKWLTASESLMGLFFFGIIVASLIGHLRPPKERNSPAGERTVVGHNKDGALAKQSSTTRSQPSRFVEETPQISKPKVAHKNNDRKESGTKAGN